MEDILTRIRRTSKLGKLGENLAAEALEMRGFSNVKNLNDLRNNYPFADLLAERAGRRYFIGVKARNEERDIGGLNEAYNCVLVPDVVNKRLKAQGKSAEEITAIALAQVRTLAHQFGAIPAWIAIPIRPAKRAYAVYFGLLTDLGNRRSIPMTHVARSKYECLMGWTIDPRITSGLCNSV